MKKLALFLALLLVVCLTACSDEKPSSPAAPSSNKNNSSSAASSKEEAPATDEIRIEEQVLVDESGIRITAKEISFDSFMGPEIKLLIENNTEKDLTIQCRNSSINGFMVDAMMSVDISSGKKANDSLSFMNSDLEDSLIDTISEIEFSFHIFETENWGEAFLDTTIIHLKTNAEALDAGYIPNGENVYTDESISIYVEGLSEDASIMGPEIMVYIENTGTESVTVQIRDSSINGFMVDGVFSSEVLPGKKIIDSISFFKSDLEENGIDKIETVELSFHIFNSGSWSESIDSDLITLNF